MAGVLLSGAQSIYEGFAPVNGFVNGCGQASVLVMAHLVNGAPLDTNTLLNTIKYSIATGNATTKGSHIGSTSPAELQWLAEQEGVITKLGSGGSWRSTVDSSLAQGKPVVMGVSNARAFGGSDANVSGHYVTFVGSLGDGRYVVADPNQQAARTGGTVVYNASQINQAKPFATLVPVSATASTQAFTSNGASGASPNCTYSIHWNGIAGQGGGTICMDPLVDGIARGGLILAGLLLITIGILIFTRKEWEPVAGSAVKGAGAAALA